MNAKLIKLIRQKAKEEDWSPAQIKAVVEVINSLTAEGRAEARKLMQTTTIKEK
jgi:hypothetical protein